MARPTKYLKKYAEQAAKLCDLGATDNDLADFFEVSQQTIYNWMAAQKEFFESVTRAKETWDTKVERAMFQRAVGYTYDSEKIFHHQGVVTRAPCKEHVPPDPGAGLNWLKNRKRDEWSDTQKHEHLLGDDAVKALAERRARANQG